MIRLLSVQPVAERGGSDQALLRMVRSLPSDEFDCHIVVPGPSPMHAELTRAGATLHVVPMRRLSTSHGALDWLAYGAGWPVAVGRLTRLTRRLDIDVVHTNSLHSLYGWAAARLTGRPHVWHAREIVVQSDAALRLERFLARRFAARVIAMSEAVAAQLDQANVEVIYESADADEFRPERAGRFRGAVGIADDVALVGSASRIDSWKGIDVLLDAFTLVRAQRPDAGLVIAGGPVAGKERLFAELEARARAIPAVEWLGFRADMPELLADLDVFVLPSSEPEPYGLVAVEALASGVPVVVTDAGGAPEVLARAAAGSGRSVARRDPAALARAILELLPEAGSTSAVLRRHRAGRQPECAESFAGLFREVAPARGRHRAVG
jgi:glycosyltransferase involved in cell wall biosynthesis